MATAAFPPPDRVRARCRSTCDTTTSATNSFDESWRHIFCRPRTRP